MKNLHWIPLLLLTAHAVTATAQNYCPDTINHPNPKYFYYFDSEKWINSDTLAKSWDLVRTGEVQDSDGDGWTVFFKYDSVLHEIHHELKTALQQNSNDEFTSRDEGLYYNYTPRPLKVVGMAAHIIMANAYLGCVWRNPDSTEHLLFYDARPDTFVCRRRQPMDVMGDSVRWERLRLRNTTPALCCNNLTKYYITIPFIESYFDHPILVKDSFYIGGSAYSYNRFAPHDSNTTVLVYDAFLAGANNGLQQVGIDTCKLIRTKYIWRYHEVPSYWPYTPYQWYRTDATGITPQIYPIYEEMCPVVEGVHVEHSQSDEVTVAWNAHGSHTVWMVTYGPLGMPRDSFAVVACLQPSITITGLDSTMIYDISVQAQCDYHVSDLEPLDADVLNNRDTTFVSEQGKHLYLRGGNLVSINDVTPDDGITLRPNPADRQVTVSATMPIKHVEVYDLAGRLVEALQPNGTTLQLDLKSYPTGTYLVKVTTANGTTTKKLVVK